MSNKQLKIIAAMLRRYEWVCDIYCMKPWTHQAYLDLLELYWRG